MATDTERFTSKFRKDRLDTRRERVERRAKAFEPTDSTDTKESGTTRSAVSVSVRSSARPAGSPARNEASRSDTGKSELESVTSRINRLRVHDDRDGTEEPTPTRHNESNEDDHERKQHIERKERGVGATTSKKRQQRKNLREKRRSTGVVIMPNMEGDTAGTDDSQKVMENTHANEAVGKSEGQGKGKQRGRSDELDSIDKETLIEQL